MKQIYNEGRVVGYSNYDLYVRQLLSTSPTAVPMTERQWLTANLSESCSMILKIPNGTRKGYHDYILPENSDLCCCTSLYASVFQGRVSLQEDGTWALRVEDYGNLVYNTFLVHPQTPGEPEDVPAKPDPGTITEASKSRYREYAKITSGLMFQPGEWIPTTYYTQLLTEEGEIVITQQAQELLVPANDAELAVNLKPDLTKRGFIRLAISEDLVDDVYVYLHGFVSKSILSGEVSYNIQDISTKPEDGDFLGPSVYPWACPIIFVVTNEVEWVRLEDMEHEWAGDLSEVKRRLTRVEDRATALEDRCGLLENRATALENRTTVVEERCDDLEEETEDLGNRATALEEGLSATNSRVTAAETQISALTTDVTALQDRCANIENDVRGAQAEINNLKTRCTTIENDISALKTRCTNIETKNTSQDTSISNLTTRMTTAEGTITTNTSDITALKTRCTNIETKNTSQDTEINNLKTRCTNIETKNTQQDTSIGQLQTDFTAFKNTTNTRCTDIENVNTNQSNELADHETRITALENSGSVAALETRVSAIEADYVKSSAISDMATKTWVGQQGYLTSGSLSGYATTSWVSSNFASDSDLSTVEGNIDRLLDRVVRIEGSYASTTWVAQNYASEYWVTNNFASLSDVGRMTTTLNNLINTTNTATRQWVYDNFVQK